MQIRWNCGVDSLNFKTLDNKKIGNMLKQKRIANYMTQKEVAGYLGRTPTWISNIERGAQQISLDRAAMLCQLYSCSLDDIIFFVDKDV